MIEAFDRGMQLAFWACGMPQDSALRSVGKRELAVVLVTAVQQPLVEHHGGGDRGAAIVELGNTVPLSVLDGKASMATHEIETDYLVVGAGINGLGVVDELLDRSDAHITIVDRRDAPGGHWNDAYSFVKLHQPSTFYGVGSTELGDGRVDADGPNEGFLSPVS